MDTPIRKALLAALECSDGSATRLARRLGAEVKRQNVEYWIKRGDIPMQYGARLEAACGGAVRRWEMWPTTWHLIWPELIDMPGAPAALIAEGARDAA